MTDKPDNAINPVPNAADQTNEADINDLWGAMRGTVTILPGVDLSEPTGEVWDALSEEPSEPSALY
jgi:hypothetical protein